MFERVNSFFGKVKKRLSEVKHEDIAEFIAKEAVWNLPVVGQIIRDAFEEFSPNEKEELIKEMKELSEIQFKEISESIGVSIGRLEDIKKFTLYTFDELRADHAQMTQLLLRVIEMIEQQHGWLYTEGIRPTTDQNTTFGRLQEMEEIDGCLKYSSALVITGCSGTGKSILASMYIDRVEKREGFAGICWRKVDKTIDINDVVGSFFTCIDKPIKEIERYKVEDLLNLLLRELNAAPYFLVLDNFEILLDPQTNKPLKPGFSDLIEKANESSGRSRVLFTSQDCPAIESGIRPTCYNIGGLDDSAAIQLLRQRGLTEPDDELKKAIVLSDGHPLALILLAQLVEGAKETLSDLLSEDTLWRGEVAVNILDKVYKDRLNEEERKLLQYVSLYRVPVPVRAIATAADDTDWNEAEVTRMAFGLERKSILQKTGKNYWEESLMYNYAYNKLVDRVERHKLACQYYLDLPLPEKRTAKEDVQSLIEAHHHACMAGEYDKAASIIFDYHLHEDLDRWGNYRTLVELYEGVLPKDHFTDKPLLGSLETHGTVLGQQFSF